jgi:hypothetical protein
LAQAKALAYTSLVSLVLGGAAIFAMQHVFNARDVTEVSSLADAIALAKRQRVRILPTNSILIHVLGTVSVTCQGAEQQDNPLSHYLIINCRQRCSRSLQSG